MKVSIVGGGFAGLAAAHRCQQADLKTTLYEDGSYTGRRRGAWGEMVWKYESLPLERNVPGYVREVEKGYFVRTDGSRTVVQVPDGVILNRGEIEKHWASKLHEIEFRTNSRIDEEDFRKIAKTSDLVVDASGPFPVSRKFEETEHDVICPTLSARIEDDFSDLYPVPRALEYGKYFMWVVPQSREQATVGLGCRIKSDPGDLHQDMEDMLGEIGIDMPPDEKLYVGNDVSNNLRSLSKTAYKLEGTPVHLAGDAAGVVNKLTGFGMINAAKSGSLAVESFLRDEYYPLKLGRENFWSKMVEQAVHPVQSRMGLGGIASLTEEIEYKKFLEPSGPTDLGSSIGRLMR